MPTPAKPVMILKNEKKSHRTKAELRMREKAEEELLTGISLKEFSEVKRNLKAHKEFLRISKLLKSINKADDLYSGTINRYCLIVAECEECENEKQLLENQKQELIANKNEMKIEVYFSLYNDITKQIIAFDRQLQAKRKMLFDIEKENIMTIASSLRSIPKKPEKKINPLKEALSG